jgi:hypothetical protein
MIFPKSRDSALQKTKKHLQFSEPEGMGGGVLMPEMADAGEDHGEA